MVNRPELMVTAGSLQEITPLINAGADAFLIGNDTFGTRLAGSFTLDEIREAVKIAHAHDAKVYVSLHSIITNDIIDSLPDYVKELAEAGVDAVEFNDPAVLFAVKSNAPTLKLHWNAEMTTTNYATANYWGRRGATRAIFARELNMDEVTGMKGHLEVESQVQVHGMTNIYHSKRSLVGNYMLHQGRPVDDGSLGKERGLFLTEEDRPGEKYPIYEDLNGTHIMSSDDICILEDLHLLIEAGVNSFKIEGILKSLAYNEAVVSSYKRVIDDYLADEANYKFKEEYVDNIRKLQDPERELTFGFYYKEQVY
ncbi:peptidase U32 family protein [Paenibacillus crassostreae]|uniref:Peptidase U32 n=1 Tax=Paenibacillus crassostreae TaxID=1763538 RepID=A0A167CI36_9BACL|nr:peptidase U32 family protein [Paenibacillus crassostreae]AOZ91853.1 peptidase U32 [Paenibacillus crassostreae]OAB73224.1 peptidase U32 [Paenibacillus crassostreae]